MSEAVFNDDDFNSNDDDQTLQAAVVAAAIDGNLQVRARLAELDDVLDEPYRTTAAVLSERLRAEFYVDRHTMTAALEQRPLGRQTPNGWLRLTATEVMNLIYATTVQPGQAEAYAEILEQRLRQRRLADLRDRAVHLAGTHGDKPAQLLAEFEKLIAESATASDVCAAQQTELFELIPFAEQLVQRQQGRQHVGLDSGFQHYNNLLNGLDMGLAVLAAPPGTGKTTLAWQLGCNVAQLNRVPVIFVSMEQSKDELRIKALSRLSKLNYRDLLRGRFDRGREIAMTSLLEGMRQYGTFARHLTIVEGDATTTIDAIEQLAHARLARVGADGATAAGEQPAPAGPSRCCIIVDYLQVLPACQQDAKHINGVKDKVDLHLSALRRLARRLKSPVLVISSENRKGYDYAKLDVFKESGGIEYAADQAMILSRDLEEEMVASQRNPYESMKLHIVKNRNGERGVIKFKFYPERAEFVEVEREPFVEPEN
jgi:replicative DNA helicase